MTTIPWTIDQIGLAILILGSGILFLAGAIVTVGKAVETVRGWRKPKTDLVKKVEAHEQRLCEGNRRFGQQDTMIGSLQEGQRVLCLGMQALLESAVYGNNVEGIRAAHDGLNGFLSDGACGKK
ncbi:MAG: hypothetical protein LLF96_04170 [Eubacteriales bacterium]|nr:hypothetical protein [Eubacteriales bacterium]